MNDTGIDVKDISFTLDERGEVIDPSEITEMTEQEKGKKQIEIINALIEILESKDTDSNKRCLFFTCVDKLEELNSGNMPVGNLVENLKQKVEEIINEEGFKSFKFADGREYAADSKEVAIISMLRNQIRQIEGLIKEGVFYTKEEMKQPPSKLR